MCSFSDVLVPAFEQVLWGLQTPYVLVNNSEVLTGIYYDTIEGYVCVCADLCLCCLLVFVCASMSAYVRYGLILQYN